MTSTNSHRATNRSPPLNDGRGVTICADPLIASESLLKTPAHVSIPRTAKFIERSPAYEPCSEFIAIKTSD